jgi:phospholipid/cholesterol/gamma-HCH transport system substrate-binding protein
VPTPDLPPAGEVLDDVQKCLQSRDLTSQACQKVLADADLLTSLRAKCQKDKYASNPVCTVLNTLPGVPLDQLPTVLGTILGNVLGRSAGSGPTSPPADPSVRQLYGGTP